MVTIEIKVGDQVVAKAHLKNLSRGGSPICDYGVSARTEAWAGMDIQGYTLSIQDYNRNQSVWHLVRRAVDGILEREKARIGDPRYMSDG